MILTERQHKAVAINLDGRKVLTYDLDMHDDDRFAYDAGGKAVKIQHSKNPRYDGSRKRCQLRRDYETKDDGIFYISECCTGLTAADPWNYYTESAEYANAPALEHGDRCAILCFSRRRNYTEVHTMVFCNSNRFEEEDEAATMGSILRILRS